MKNKFQIVLTLILTLSFTDLKAGTLLDSLNTAYSKNSKLNGERDNVRAINEDKKGALREEFMLAPLMIFIRLWKNEKKCLTWYILYLKQEEFLVRMI